MTRTTRLLLWRWATFCSGYLDRGLEARAWRNHRIGPGDFALSRWVRFQGASLLYSLRVNKASCCGDWLRDGGRFV
jgi:hypothetical protein